MGFANNGDTLRANRDMDRKTTLAHIINPVAAPPASDLNTAQPITFESMRVAKEFADNRCDVRFFTAQYPEDHSVLPDGFQVTPDLDRSVLDVATFQVPRKLPLISDILNRLYTASDAEYFIYTNVDIAVMPNFYATVSSIIDTGVDACVINRRTISTHYTHVDELPLMYAEVGTRHPGYDCFIFRRHVLPRFELGMVCIGAPRVGFVLVGNLICFSKRFREFAEVHLTFHIGNERQWRDPRFQDYTDHNTRETTELYQRLMPKFDRSNLPDVTMPRLREFLNQLRTLPA